MKGGGMRGILQYLILLGLAVLITGCKVAVIVLEGGEVQSEGAGTCAPGTNCIVEVGDNYSDTFTAVPAEGWYFEKWNSGYGFLCGGSIKPNCLVSNKEADSSDINVLGLIRSDTTFYLMPVFWRKPPTVIAGDKEWLRPEEFPYTAEEVRAICPGPDGVCTGQLEVRHFRGIAGGGMFNLTGYIWASSEEVSSLFNAYGVDPPFTGPNQTRTEQSAMSDFAEDFDFVYDLSTGFHGGLVRDPHPSEDRVYGTGEIYNGTTSGTFHNKRDAHSYERGAWFWKPVE